MPSQSILFTSFSPYHAPLHAFSYVGKNHYDAIVDERALNEAKVLGELNSQDIYEHRKTIERAEITVKTGGGEEAGEAGRPNDEQKENTDGAAAPGASLRGWESKA